MKGKFDNVHRRCVDKKAPCDVTESTKVYLRTMAVRCWLCLLMIHFVLLFGSTKVLMLAGSEKIIFFFSPAGCKQKL